VVSASGQRPVPCRGADEPFEVEIPPQFVGERLDRALAALHPTISRATFQRWIDEGRVTLAGRPIVASQRARPGTRLRVEPAPPPTSTAVPQDIPLRVLYEDEHLAVIDKPAGMVVHPAPGHPDGTLVNALLFRYGDSLPDDIAPDFDDAAPEAEGHRTGSGEERCAAPGRRVAGAFPRPGIVHRLDRDTSGLLLIARTPEARKRLQALFAKHAIERVYFAIVVGEHPARATYATLHARHPRDRQRFTSKTSRGKRAVTHVERVEMLCGASLVRCHLETGRTHQVRVHLAEHGYPVLGDPLYGRPPRHARLRAVADALGRQALHAALLGFEHPITGRALRFETPPPEDMECALQALRMA
jgi:23S rRNA pseudouridine1911/1915/1917 synthase